MGFGVGLWNWLDHDLAALEKTGATFTIMNGYLEGRPADDAGGDMLLESARGTTQVGKRLGVHRLNLDDVNSGAYPALEHGVPMTDKEFAAFREAVEQGRV